MSPIYTPGKLVLKKDSVAVDPNTDPNIASVSLLLYGNGTNGSTTIIDSSPSPKAVTAFGNAQISTAQSKFGGASIAFDGVSDYLTVASSAGLTFGTGDFTIELWLYVISYTNAITWFVGTYTGQAPVGLWSFYAISSGASLAFRNADTNVVTQSLSSSIATGLWNHLAVTRNSGSLRFFLNGTLQGSAVAFTDNLNQQGIAGIGSAAPIFFYVGEVNGYIDDLRITKGVARYYTANFTPPTEPFPNY